MSLPLQVHGKCRAFVCFVCFVCFVGTQFTVIRRLLAKSCLSLRVFLPSVIMKLLSVASAALFTTLAPIMIPSQAAPVFADASRLPSQTSFPDPLLTLNGQKITSAEQWREMRRLELKALFQHYMYGALPPKPVKIDFTTRVVDQSFLAGKATLKLVTIEFGSAQAPRIDLMLVVPNGRAKAAPAFLAMN